MSDGASASADTQAVSTGGTGQPEGARIRPDIAALYSRYRQLMSDTAFRVLGPEGRGHVDDVVQEALIRAAGHLTDPSKDVPSNWAAWLTTITTRCALTQVKKDRTYDKYVDEWQRQNTPAARSERPGSRPPAAERADPVADEVIARDQEQRLRALIALLPEDEGTMAYLMLFEGYSFKKIGDQLVPTVSGQWVGRVLGRVCRELAAKLDGDPQ